jgi:hypothetical protein
MTDNLSCIMMIYVKTDVAMRFIIVFLIYLLSCVLTIGIFDKHLSLLASWHIVGTVHFTDIGHLSTYH